MPLRQVGGGGITRGSCSSPRQGLLRVQREEPAGRALSEPVGVSIWCLTIRQQC